MFYGEKKNIFCVIQQKPLKWILLPQWLFSASLSTHFSGHYPLKNPIFDGFISSSVKEVHVASLLFRFQWVSAPPIGFENELLPLAFSQMHLDANVLGTEPRKTGRTKMDCCGTSVDGHHHTLLRISLITRICQFCSTRSTLEVVGFVKSYRSVSFKVHVLHVFTLCRPVMTSPSFLLMLFMKLIWGLWGLISNIPSDSRPVSERILRSIHKSFCQIARNNRSRLNLIWVLEPNWEPLVLLLLERRYLISLNEEAVNVSSPWDNTVWVCKCKCSY